MERSERMTELLSKHKQGLGVAALICLSFLLMTTGYLAWLQNLRILAEAPLVEMLSLVCAYLAQAVGVGAYMLIVRTGGAEKTSRLTYASLVLQLLLHIPAIVWANLALVVISGLLANVLYGVVLGHYLVVLCTLVSRERRGTVFGCAYGASTLLTWLLSLVANGALASGIPSIVCCCAMGAGVAALMRALPLPSEEGEPVESEPLDAAQTGTLAIMCVAIALVCLVKNACFAFPVSDLDSGISLELTRVLYGLGLVLFGVISDYNRRLGLVACAISLVLPFCMLALSGAGSPAVVLWLLGYLLTSIYTLFGVLLAADYAEDVARPVLSCLGLLLHRVGLALGSGLALALASSPQLLIAVTAVLLIATAVIVIVLDQRLFAHKAEIAKAEPPELPEERERRQLERFSSAYGLSAREREVLPLLVSGKTNAEIAAELFVTERTVKFHVHNIMEKTGCPNRLAVTDLFNAGVEG